MTLFLSDLVPFFWHLHSLSRCVYAEPENQQQTIALIVILAGSAARNGRRHPR